MRRRWDRRPASKTYETRQERRRRRFEPVEAKAKRHDGIKPRKRKEKRKSDQTE